MKNYFITLKILQVFVLAKLGSYPLGKCQSSSVLFMPTRGLSYDANVSTLGHNLPVVFLCFLI